MLNILPVAYCVQNYGQNFAGVIGHVYWIGNNKVSIDPLREFFHKFHNLTISDVMVANNECYTN